MRKTLLSICSVLAFWELSASAAMEPFPNQQDIDNVSTFYNKTFELSELEDQSLEFPPNPSEEEMQKFCADMFERNQKSFELNIQIGDLQDQLAPSLEKYIGMISTELNTPDAERLKSLFPLDISSVRILDPILMIKASSPKVHEDGQLTFKYINEKLNLINSLQFEDEEEKLSELILKFFTTECTFSSESFKQIILKNIEKICETKSGRELLSLVIAKYISIPSFSDFLSLCTLSPLSTFSFSEMPDGSFHKIDCLTDEAFGLSIGVCTSRKNTYYITMLRHPECIATKNEFSIYPATQVSYKISHELGHFVSQSITNAAKRIERDRTGISQDIIFDGSWFDKRYLLAGGSEELFQIHGIALLRFGSLDEPKYTLLLNPWSDLAMSAEIGAPVRDSHIGAFIVPSIYPSLLEKDRRVMLTIENEYGYHKFGEHYAPNFAYYDAMLRCFGSSLPQYTFRVMYNDKFAEYMKKEHALATPVVDATRRAWYEDVD